jgi:hypothetical protein
LLLFNPLTANFNGDNFSSLAFFSIAFPMAEVISTYIPPSFYEVSTEKVSMENRETF